MKSRKEDINISLHEGVLEETRNKYSFIDELDFNEWESIDSRVAKRCLSDQEDVFSKGSMTLKSFRNEYEINSLFSKGTIKSLKEDKFNFYIQPRVPSLKETSMEILIPGYNPDSFIPITSCLTYIEMVTCLGIIENGLPRSRELLAIWKDCKLKLDEEQIQYMEYAREQWMTEGSKRQTIIKTEIKELVDLLWKARLERVYTYPKFYLQKENISMMTSNAEEVDLKFIKQLESVGRLPRYYIPDLWTFVVNVNTAYNSIQQPTLGWSRYENNLDNYYKQIHPRLIECGYHSDVSKDRIAEKLAKENGVNIVMSSSAFSCLIDRNICGSKSWILPISVLEYQTDHGVKRIAFIDKKLPLCSMTAMDRMKYYSKLALRKLFVRCPQDYRDPATSVYDADFEETFGIDGPIKKKTFRNLKKQKKVTCKYCLNKESTCAEMSDEESLNERNKLLSKNCAPNYDDKNSFFIDETYSNKMVSSKYSPTNSQPHLTSSLENKFCTCTYEWVVEKGDFPIKKKKLNFNKIYNLWDFKSSASKNYMSKNCSKDLKVIIRTTIEGKVVEKTQLEENPIHKHYKLSPKLEYQTEFGAMTSSLSEMLKEWASLYIRPSANLARVRLDGVTGELIQIQHLGLDDLAGESQRNYNVNPKDRLPGLHNLLVKLSDLPPGNYVLQHSSPNVSFVNLYKKVDRGGSNTFNLHLQYNMVDPTKIAQHKSAFPQLDTTVITPTFKHFRRIPCTFAPKKCKKQSLLKDNSAVNPPQSPKPRKTKLKKKKKQN